uniref:Uncharacterized protein n=1 Tax=Ralstonia solanacearum TaxID=305 RepID=A0A0S4U6F7_RALSL|nr:protein of unknown function [Ralstonia solanacearum]
MVMACHAPFVPGTKSAAGWGATPAPAATPARAMSLPVLAYSPMGTAALPALLRKLSSAGVSGWIGGLLLAELALLPTLPKMCGTWVVM